MSTPRIKTVSTQPRMAPTDNRPVAISRPGPIVDPMIDDGDDGTLVDDLFALVDDPTALTGTSDVVLVGFKPIMAGMAAHRMIVAIKGFVNRPRMRG